MKSFSEASDIIFENIIRSAAVRIPIEHANNYILAEDIQSPINVSPFRNSAMDGFAVLYADIKEIPITLPIAGAIFAGGNARTAYKSNTAIKIMTGAAVPDGYDSVIPIEELEFNDTEVTIKKPVNQFQFVRKAGEDIKKDEILFKAGDVLKQIHIGILASVGLKEVNVFKKPDVLILSVGDELVEPGDRLKFGQIYDSNSYTIQSLINPLCQNINIASIVRDVPEIISDIFSQKKYDLILTSGGVSTGDKDFIPNLSDECGWEKILHKISIKPGKPFFCAKREHQCLFGLPGNPLSTAVTCAIFVVPALKKMIGVRNYRLNPVNVELNKANIIESDRTVIWPGKIIQKREKYTATLSDKRSSAALSALIDSDGLIFIEPSNSSSNKAGAIFWPRILNI